MKNAQKSLNERKESAAGGVVYLTPFAAFQGQNQVSFKREPWLQDELDHALLHHDFAYYPVISDSISVPPTIEMEYLERQGFLKPYKIASMAKLTPQIGQFSPENEFKSDVALGFRALRRQFGDEIVITPTYQNFNPESFDGSLKPGFQWEIETSIPRIPAGLSTQEKLDLRDRFSEYRPAWRNHVSSLVQEVIMSERPETTLVSIAADISSEFLHQRIIAENIGLSVFDVTIRVLLEIGSETFEAVEQLGSLFDTNLGRAHALAKLASGVIKIHRGAMKIIDERNTLRCSPIAYPALFHANSRN